MVEVADTVRVAVTRPLLLVRMAILVPNITLKVGDITLAIPEACRDIGNRGFSNSRNSIQKIGIESVFKRSFELLLERAEQSAGVNVLWRRTGNGLRLNQVSVPPFGQPRD
jgi:hypothetical protein